jgi:hypothetical protein
VFAGSESVICFEDCEVAGGNLKQFSYLRSVKIYENSISTLLAIPFGVLRLISYMYFYVTN